MERHVKERLVGAAVLMAAAIILIPEMLSGPDEAEVESTASATSQGSDTPIKTYTIDLNQPPGEATASLMEERAPPPEEMPPATSTAAAEPAADIQEKPETSKDSSPAEHPASTSSAAEIREAAAEVVESPTPPARVPSKPVPQAVASASAAPTSSGWAVQLGSFSKQATAERMKRELSTAGHDVFVMPVKSGSGTLYRVRIGPMKDRASAEAVLRRVKAGTPGAAVVLHP